jgi:rare lipoprotein A
MTVSAQPEPTLKLGEPRSATIVRERLERRTVIAHTHNHTEDGLDASTVFVRNIPVLTVRSTAPQEATAPGTSVKLPSSPQDASQPKEQARVIAAMINQAHSDGLDAQGILPRWEAGQYIIQLAGHGQVIVGEQVRFAQTTGDVARDTIHATNSLRRLLGGAEPITAIANAPVAVGNASASRNIGALANPVVEVVRSGLTQVSRVVASLTGLASWYGPGFAGRPSASGEIFNPEHLTAAHPSLPFGTLVRVVNPDNGRSVVVRINDRGPFHGSRLLDLSMAAARELGIISSGVATIRMEVLGR